MLDISRLSELNHWWKMGKVREEFALPYQRSLFKELLKYLDMKQMLCLVGLRRVGKTTLFYQLMDHLIKQKTDPKHIIYFTFDESNTEIDELIKTYEEEVIGERINPKKKYFIFLDEIQKLDDWQNKIKIIYDIHPNIKFFISGSASINILLPAKESLAGRIFYFNLDPLSFEEFLELKGKDVKELKKKHKLWERELRIELNNYMLRPFPDIVNSPEDVAKKYLKETIIERVILKDLSSLFEVREIESLEKIVNVIAAQPGMIINLDDMSKDFGISRQTLSNYLYYLRCCFLVNELRNYRGSIKTSSRKLKKYYMSHPCFSIALSSVGKGEIAESAVAFKAKSEHFWRNRDKEVDFIQTGKPVLPVEVKYRHQITKKDLKHLSYFMDKFKAKNALMVTDDKEGEDTIKKKQIRYIPLWKFLLFE